MRTVDLRPRLKTIAKPAPAVAVSGAVPAASVSGRSLLSG